MNKPNTYSEWSDLLYKLKQGIDDDVTIRQLEAGTIGWTRGVAEKLTRLVFDVLEERLKRVTQNFQVEVNWANYSETSLAIALMNARRRFGFLNRLCRLQAFPEQVRKSFTDIIIQYVRDTQQSLEDSAKEDRSGRLRMLIKNNSLLNYEEYDNESVSKSVQIGQPSGEESIGFTTTRRRVLFK